MLLNTINHPGFCSPWIKFMLLNTINHIGFCLTHVAQHNQSSWIFLHPGFNTCCSTRSSWMFLNWIQHVGWRKIQARASIASTCPSSRRWQVACSWTLSRALRISRRLLRSSSPTVDAATCSSISGVADLIFRMDIWCLCVYGWCSFGVVTRQLHHGLYSFGVVSRQLHNP